MPDSTTTPPAPEVSAPATRRPRGVINVKYLDEIELVRALVLQARLPECVAPLTARECLPAEIDELENTAGLLNQETLKGVTAADLAELESAHDAYIDKDSAQTTTSNEAGTLRQQVETLYDQVRDQRIDLQLAADQAWPHTNPANAPIRRAFSIPENRPAIE